MLAVYLGPDYLKTHSQNLLSLMEASLLLVTNGCKGCYSHYLAANLNWARMSVNVWFMSHPYLDHLDFWYSEIVPKALGPFPKSATVPPKPACQHEAILLCIQDCETHIIRYYIDSFVFLLVKHMSSAPYRYNIQPTQLLLKTLFITAVIVHYNFHSCIKEGIK